RAAARSPPISRSSRTMHASRRGSPCNSRRCRSPPPASCPPEESFLSQDRTENRKPTFPDPASCVLVVGDVMTDIICKPAGPLVIGSDRRAAIRARPGGSGANQAVWLASFGVPVHFAGRVGTEDHAALVAHFAELGVEAMLGADAEHPSGAIVTIVSP